MAFRRPSSSVVVVFVVIVPIIVVVVVRRRSSSSVVVRRRPSSPSSSTSALPKISPTPPCRLLHGRRSPPTSPHRLLHGRCRPRVAPPGRRGRQRHPVSSQGRPKHPHPTPPLVILWPHLVGRVLLLTTFSRKCAATKTSRNVERMGPGGVRGVTPCREQTLCSRHFREHGFAFHEFLPQMRRNKNLEKRRADWPSACPGGDPLP